MKRQIKFIGHAVKWFDRINGNTYHGVQVTRMSDSEMLYCPFTYGYGDHFKWIVETGLKRECVAHGTNPND